MRERILFCSGLPSVREVKDIKIPAVIKRSSVYKLCRHPKNLQAVRWPRPRRRHPARHACFVAVCWLCRVSSALPSANISDATHVSRPHPSMMTCRETIWSVTWQRQWRSLLSVLTSHAFHSKQSRCPWVLDASLPCISASTGKWERRRPRDGGGTDCATMDDGSVCVPVSKSTILLNPYSSMTAVSACRPAFWLLQYSCSSPCITSILLRFGLLHPEIGRAKADMALSTSANVLRRRLAQRCCDGLWRRCLARKVECQR
jgi:hypothetical protein